MQIRSLNSSDSNRHLVRKFILYCAVPILCNYLVGFLFGQNILYIIPIIFVCVFPFLVMCLGLLSLPNMSFYLGFWGQTKQSAAAPRGSRQHTSPDEPCEQSAAPWSTLQTHTHTRAHTWDHSSVLTRWSMSLAQVRRGSAPFFHPVLLWLKSACVWWCVCSWPLTPPGMTLCVELNRLLGRRADRKMDRREL